MGNWNANNPTVLGLEWFPYLSGVQQIDSLSQALGVFMTPSTAETINAGRVWIPQVSAPGTYVLEMYKDGEQYQSPYTTVQYSPNEDVNRTNVQGVPNDGQGQLYTNIDELPEQPTYSDYLRQITTATMLYEGRLNTAGVLTGRRVLEVKMRFAIFCYKSTIMSIAGSGLNIGGVVYDETTARQHSIAAYSSPNLAIQEITWVTNPATGLPWTVADIQAFDSTDEFRVFMTTWSAPGGVQTPGDARVLAVSMQVVHCLESRQAFGGKVFTTTSVGQWAEFPLLTPAGGSYSKTTAQNYFFLLRRVSTSGSLQVATVTHPSGMYLKSGTGYMYDRGATLDQYGMFVSGTDPVSAVIPLILRLAAAADAVDSQPYTAALQTQINSSAGLQQEFQNATAQPYSTVRFLVKCDATPGPTEPLTVTIKRRSDNTPFGSTITLTPAQVLAAPDIGDGWRLWEERLTSGATLAAGTQYYFDIASATPNWVGYQWYFIALDTQGQGNGVGFGGTSDQATYAGSDNANWDVPITLSASPAGPTVFTGSLVSRSVGADGSEGTVPSLEEVQFNWSNPAFDPAQFGYYEMQRSEDGGTTYSSIYKDTTQNSYLSHHSPDKGQNCPDPGTLVDLDVRVLVAAGDWVPTSYETLIAQGRAASSNYAFGFYLDVNGLRLEWSTTGSDTLSANSTNALPPQLLNASVVNGIYVLWLRATLDVDNGSAQRVVTFYYSFDGVTWTTLQQITQANATSIFNSTSSVTLGTGPSATRPMSGSPRFFKAELRSAINGTVLTSPDFTAQAAGAVSFVDGQGITWSCGGGSTIVAPTRFIDQEGKRGVQATYRLRLFRADGSYSDWTSTVTATPAALKSDVYSFVSNEAPTLGCIFKKVSGLPLAFPSSDEVELHPIYGRDFYVALQPTENRGVQAELSVILSTLHSYDRGSNPLGPALYTRLRTLSTSTLSYVCVHDPYGNRLLSKIRVPEGEFSDNVVWLAKILVAQITSTFSKPPSG